MADTPQINKSVSIQLSLGGHSFSDAMARCRTTMAAADSAVVYLATLKTTLVPAEMFDAEHADSHLANVGYALAVDECVVVDSSSQKGVVALMAVAQSVIAELSAACGGRVEYRTPLLRDEAVADGVVMHLSGDVLYVRLYVGGRLLFAETVAAQSDADVLYYLATIDEVYGIFNMYARACGDTKRLVPLAKRLFRSVSCE